MQPQDNPYTSPAGRPPQQASIYPPVRAPQQPIAPVEVQPPAKSAEIVGRVSFVCFSLFLLSFFIPFFKLLDLPLFIIGIIAGFQTIGRTKNSSVPRTKTVQLFRTVAIIGITIAAVIIGGIALLIYSFAASGV